MIFNMNTSQRPLPVTPKPILSHDTINLISPASDHKLNITPNNIYINAHSTHAQRYATAPVYSPPPYTDPDTRTRLSSNSKNKLFAAYNNNDTIHNTSNDSSMMVTPISPSAPIQDNDSHIRTPLYTRAGTPPKPIISRSLIDIQQQLIDSIELTNKQQYEINQLRDSNNKLQSCNDELILSVESMKRDHIKSTAQQSQLLQYIDELRAKLRANKISVPCNAAFNQFSNPLSPISAKSVATNLLDNNNISLIDISMNDMKLSSSSHTTAKHKWTSAEHQHTVKQLQQQSVSPPIDLVNDTSDDEHSIAEHKYNNDNSDNDTYIDSPEQTPVINRVQPTIQSPVNNTEFKSPTTATKRTLTPNDLFNKSDTDLAYLNIYSSPLCDTMESEWNELLDIDHHQLIQHIVDKMLMKSIQHSKSYEQQNNPSLFSNRKINKSRHGQSPYTNTGKGLELYCGMLFSSMGYTAVINGSNGGGGDKGIDIKLYKSTELVSVVQCKQYTDRCVTRDELDDYVYAVRQHITHTDDSCYFINTCNDKSVKPFPIDSVTLYAQYGIQLIDRQKLLSMSLPYTRGIYKLYLKYERREEQYNQYITQINKTSYNKPVRSLVYSDNTPCKPITQPSKIGAYSLQSPAQREKSPNNTNTSNTTTQINGQTVTVSLTLHSPTPAVPANNDIFNTEYNNNNHTTSNNISSKSMTTYIWRCDNRIQILLTSIRDWCTPEYIDGHHTQWDKMCTVTNSLLYELKLQSMSDRDWSESCRNKYRNIRDTICRNKSVRQWLGMSEKDIESIYQIDGLHTRAIDTQNQYRFCRCDISRILLHGWNCNKQCIDDSAYKLLCCEIMILLRVCNDVQYNTNNCTIDDAIINYCIQQKHYNNSRLTQYGKYLKRYKPNALSES